MFDMKYLCFLAYMFINLVNCRFFVTSDYSLQKQVQYTLFLFLCSRFHKAEITSRRSLYYVRTYLLLRRDVANATSGRIFYCIGTYFLPLLPSKNVALSQRLKFRMWFKYGLKAQKLQKQHALKGQKLLAQGGH